MTPLSDQLAELSERVRDIEGRISVFKNEQSQVRAEKVDALKSRVEKTQDRLTTTLGAKSNEISSAWAEFNRSMQAKASAIRTAVVEKKDAIDASHAQDRADRLEYNAVQSVDFALLAIEDAELAVIEAVDARIHAESLK